LPYNERMEPIYKRVVVKVSGEALGNDDDRTILDKAKLAAVASSIKELSEMGVQVAVVVGAGNIWRGRLADSVGIDHSTGDYMGMLGTIINALALQSAFEEKGLTTRVMSAINVPQVSEPYIRRKAVSHLEAGRIVIFAGGTGNPFFTTDTTATLRALDIGAEAIVMGKNGVDGVYDSDPRAHKGAKLLKKLTYREVIERKLEVMDLTAVAMLSDTNIKINVFNMDDPHALIDVLVGKDIGSVIAK